jgi:hypothetical protein
LGWVRRMLPGFIPAIARPRYRAFGVNFDGTNDNLNRGGGLTGAADATSFTFSGWMRAGADGASKVIIAAPGVAGTAGRLLIQTRVANSFRVAASNSSGTTILDYESAANGVTVAAGWVHCLTSARLSSTSERWIYLNDVSSIGAVTTYTNTTIDFTLLDWIIGLAGDNSARMNGDLADVMFWPGVYTDFSVTANRRLFIDAIKKPVNPAVAIAALGTPIIQLSGPTSGWATNKGSGGGFTMTGALTDATSAPGD